MFGIKLPHIFCQHKGIYKLVEEFFCGENITVRQYTGYYYCPKCGNVMEGHWDSGGGWYEPLCQQKKDIILQRVIEKKFFIEGRDDDISTDC